MMFALISFLYGEKFWTFTILCACVLRVCAQASHAHVDVYIFLFAFLSLVAMIAICSWLRTQG